MEDSCNSAGLIECVLSLPEMYTPFGTFGEAIAFLTGYYSAKAGFPREQYPFVAREVDNWQDFVRYLRDKEAVDTPRLWQVLRGRYQNDEQCIKSILSKYRDLMQNQRA